MRLHIIVKGSVIAAAAVAGVLIGGGTAHADGHNVSDQDGTWGSADGPEQRGQDLLPAVQILDLSAPVVPQNRPVSSYPAEPQNIPAGSYPAAPSWPGSGFGVAD